MPPTPGALWGGHRCPAPPCLATARSASESVFPTALITATKNNPCLALHHRSPSEGWVPPRRQERGCSPHPGSPHGLPVPNPHSRGRLQGRLVPSEASSEGFGSARPSSWRKSRLRQDAALAEGMLWHEAKATRGCGHAWAQERVGGTAGLTAAPFGAATLMNMDEYA